MTDVVVGKNEEDDDEEEEEAAAAARAAVHVPDVMAVTNVKREQEFPTRGILTPEKKSVPGEINRWITPLKSSPGAVAGWLDAVKTPVKAERSFVSNSSEDGKCGVRLSAADGSSSFSFIESPLRCCPNFENVAHSAEEAGCEEKNGKILNSPFAGGVQSQTSKLEHTLNSDEMMDEGDVFRESKTRVDFSGGQLADDGYQPDQDMDDDICITGSKYGVINLRCPLSGRLVTELEDPVQSIKCHHVYGQAYAKAYVNQPLGISKCAVAGCSEFLTENDFASATSLTESIGDLREKDSTSRLRLMMECIHLEDD